MPGSGIAATARIAAALPGTPIVILTVSRDDNDLFDALRAGASGYPSKDLGDDQVAPAVTKALVGEASLPGTLVARLVEEFRDPSIAASASPPSRRLGSRAAQWTRRRPHARGTVDQRDRLSAVRVTHDGAHPRVVSAEEAPHPDRRTRPCDCWKPRALSRGKGGGLRRSSRASRREHFPAEEA